jgi:hypothetical protein
MVREEPEALARVRTHCDGEMEAVEATVECSRLLLENVFLSSEIPDGARKDLEQALERDEMRVYMIARSDWPQTQVVAIYRPNHHTLVLLYKQMVERARDIPSLHLGLHWWMRQPQIWREHVLGE